MFRFPFYGFPYNYSYYNYYKKNMNNVDNKNIEKENSITNSLEISNTINQAKDDNQAVFELFGIKIFTDDLIILGLLFFLYQENVKDDILYIILFLLLFS